MLRLRHDLCPTPSISPRSMGNKWQGKVKRGSRLSQFSSFHYLFKSGRTRVLYCAMFLAISDTPLLGVPTFLQHLCHHLRCQWIQCIYYMRILSARAILRGSIQTNFMLHVSVCGKLTLWPYGSAGTCTINYAPPEGIIVVNLTS